MNSARQHILGTIKIKDVEGYLLCDILDGKLFVATMSEVLASIEAIYGVSKSEQGSLVIGDGAESTLPHYEQLSPSVNEWKCTANKERIIILSKNGDKYNIAKPDMNKFMPLTVNGYPIKVGIVLGTVTEAIILTLYNNFMNKYNKTPFFNITIADNVIKARNADYPVIDYNELKHNTETPKAPETHMSAEAERKLAHLHKLKKTLNFKIIFTRYFNCFKYTPEGLVKEDERKSFNVTHSLKECKIIREEIVYEKNPEYKDLYNNLSSYVRSLPVKIGNNTIKPYIGQNYILIDRVLDADNTKDIENYTDIYIEYLFNVALFLGNLNNLKATQYGFDEFENSKYILRHLAAFFFLPIKLIDIVCEYFKDNFTLRKMLLSLYTLFVFKYFNLINLRKELREFPDKAADRVKSVINGINNLTYNVTFDENKESINSLLYKAYNSGGYGTPMCKDYGIYNLNSYPYCIELEYDYYKAHYLTLVELSKRPTIQVANIPYDSPVGFAIMGYCIKPEDAGKIFPNGLHTTELRYIFNDYYFEDFKDILTPYIRCYGDFYFAHRIITCLLQPRFTMCESNYSIAYELVFMRGAASFMYLCMYNKDLANCIIKIIESLMYARATENNESLPEYIKNRHELELAFYQNIYNIVEYLGDVLYSKPWYKKHGMLYYKSGARFADPITYYPASMSKSYGDTFESEECYAFMLDLFCMFLHTVKSDVDLSRYTAHLDSTKIKSENFFCSSQFKKSLNDLTLYEVEEALQTWCIDNMNKPFDMGINGVKFSDDKVVQGVTDCVLEAIFNPAETTVALSTPIKDENESKKHVKRVVQYLTRWNLYI